VLLAEKERLKPLSPPEAWPDVPKVSVLVAAWNEAEVIERHIKSFLALCHPHKELVLCAGGHDGTYEIARRWSGQDVAVLEQMPGEGKQRALRRCYQVADGEVFFLTDADCTWEDYAFERLLAALLDGEEVVSGTYRPPEDQLGKPFVVFHWATRLYVMAHQGDYVGGLEGRNCAMTRMALESAGTFADDVPTGTDYFLAQKLLRQGHDIRLVLDSAVTTDFPEGVGAFRKKQSRWIRNLLVHGPAFQAWHDVRASLQTAVVGLGMLAAPLLFPFQGRWLPIVWSLLLVQAVLARFRHIAFTEAWTGRRFGNGVIMATIPFLFVDFLAWGSSLIDYLLPGRRGRW
jgi:cellulose synthase/poly-beta-1,6-N-acetylglucosamine synthase-like glycosyltransferase